MDLNQITIPSCDLAASVPFYERLGLKIIVDARPRYVRLECPDGASTISLYHLSEAPTGRGIQLYFECDDLDSYVATLIDRGVTFTEQPNEKPWLWREARLVDPDGNQIVLYYAGVYRKNPPWRVG